MNRAATCLFAALAMSLVFGACDDGGGARPIESAASDDGPNLVWGDGQVGVVLVHGAAFDAASWTPQAEQMAAAGATVVAVEDSDSIVAAVTDLRQHRNVSSVALIGGSAGADSIMRTVAAQPGLADQLILLSPNAVVEGLGDEPKLFIVSEDEPRAQVSRQLADVSPGDDNEVLVVPGSAHAQHVFDTDQGAVVMQAILDRLGLVTAGAG